MGGDSFRPPDETIQVWPMGDPPVNLSPVACVQSQPADKGEPLEYGMYGLGHILKEINPLKGLPESIVKSLDIENVTQSMSMRDAKSQEGVHN